MFKSAPSALDEADHVPHLPHDWFGNGPRTAGAIRQHLAEDRKNFDPRKFLKEATKAMTGICKARYEAFGSAGMASKIAKVYSLEEMYKRYEKGELDPKVN